jgi:hypothetical protein
MADRKTWREKHITGKWENIDKNVLNVLRGKYNRGKYNSFN